MALNASNDQTAPDGGQGRLKESNCPRTNKGQKGPQEAFRRPRIALRGLKPRRMVLDVGSRSSASGPHRPVPQSTVEKTSSPYKE